MTTAKGLVWVPVQGYVNSYSLSNSPRNCRDCYPITECRLEYTKYLSILLRSLLAELLNLWLWPMLDSTRINIVTPSPWSNSWSVSPRENDSHSQSWSPLHLPLMNHCLGHPWLLVVEGKARDSCSTTGWWYRLSFDLTQWAVCPQSSGWSMLGSIASPMLLQLIHQEVLHNTFNILHLAFLVVGQPHRIDISSGEQYFLIFPSSLKQIILLILILDVSLKNSTWPCSSAWTSSASMWTTKWIFSLSWYSL